MPRFRPGLAIASIMIAVIITGCSSSFVPAGKEEVDSRRPDSISGPANGLVQSNTGGQVTIDVEWIKEGDGLLIFNVAMNTHSVDLDDYDLEKLAFLRDDMGNEYQPLSWDSTPGGHHRRGTLTFNLPDSRNQGKTRYLELVILDVAGVKERVLRWEL